MLAGRTLAPVATDHAVPFHCSISTPPPVAMFCLPTATQNDEVAHETAFKALEAEPDAALALVQVGGAHQRRAGQGRSGRR